jgi:Secretion system C-terminal sorting domain
MKHILSLFFSLLLTYAQAQDVSGTVVDASNQSCDNGYINLTIGGLGVAPYDIEWTSTTGFASSSKDISGLTPGIYTVVIFDAHCCFAKLNFVVKCVPCTSEIILEGIKGVFCGQAGEIDITIKNGPPSGILYKWYRWKPDTQTWTQVNQYNTNATNGDFSPFPAGRYKVEVSFGNCNHEREFVVPDAATVKADIGVIKNVSSCTPKPLVYNGYYESSQDGIMRVELVGEKRPYKILWYYENETQPMSGSGLIRYGLKAGKYTFKADFGGGCIVDLGSKVLCCCSNTTELPSHPAIPFCASTPSGNTSNEFLEIKNVKLIYSTSAQSNNGSISFNVTPTTLSLNYYWSPNQPGANNSLTNLAPGTYCVTVTNKCSGNEVSSMVKQCFEVKDCETIEFSVSGSAVNTCEGYAKGEVNVTVAGQGPFTYKWSNGATTKSLKDLAVGKYCLTVSNSYGCVREKCFDVNASTQLKFAGYYGCGTNYSCNNTIVKAVPYQGQLNCNYENCNQRVCRCPLNNEAMSVNDHGWIGTGFWGSSGCGLNMDCRDGASQFFSGNIEQKATWINEQGVLCKWDNVCTVYLPSGGTASKIVSSGYNPQCFPAPPEFTERVIVARVQKVEPNPFSDEIRIQLTSSSKIQIIIRDMRGKIVFSQQLIDSESSGVSILLPLQSLSSGLYLLQAYSDGETILSTKIVKI